MAHLPFTRRDGALQREGYVVTMECQVAATGARRGCQMPSAGTDGCTELIAQGLGKSEFNEPPTLRESSYSVVKEDAMVLHTKQINWGGICFGDSGGPLYAVVNGELQLAGVTSTTYSQDCLVGGDHVNLRFYKPWIEGNTI